MKKNNIFNPNKNIWDIGWPCSPRKFVIYLFIGLGLIGIFVSCTSSDTVEISKEEYEHLKGDTIKPKYPKPFKLFTDDLGNFADGIVLGSDQHEYLVNDVGSSSRTVEHYVDCELCAVRTQQYKEELYRLITTLKDSVR